MKTLCFLLVLGFSQNVQATECEETKGKLETSNGTYHFNSINQCNDVYGKLKKCTQENYENAKKAVTTAKSVECIKILEEYVEKNGAQVRLVKDE